MTIKLLYGNHIRYNMVVYWFIELDWVGYLLNSIGKQVDSPINRGGAAEFSLKIICVLLVKGY